MKTIKIFATLICMVAVMSVNAQTENVKAKPAKKAVAKHAMVSSKDQKKTVPAEKNAVAKPAEIKKDQPNDKQKMKQINRPVKVTGKK